MKIKIRSIIHEKKKKDYQQRNTNHKKYQKKKKKYKWPSSVSIRKTYYDMYYYVTDHGRYICTENCIKLIFFTIDWDHGFHNIVKMPGRDNTFFHVLLTPWPRMFTGSGAPVRIPCYEILFFFFFPAFTKGYWKEKVRDIDNCHI